MNVSVGGFSGNESVEASHPAYSPNRHFLSTFLAHINGLGVSGSLLNAQPQASPGEVLTQCPVHEWRPVAQHLSSGS